MEFKSNKPLIIVSGALSVAVIALSIQVVFLTFTVKDQKDALRYIATNTDLHSMQTKVTGLQNNMLDISRELETIRNTSSRLSGEVKAMQTIVNKVGNDSQFLQQELTNFDNRISALEKSASNAEYTLQNIQRSLRYQ